MTQAAIAELIATIDLLRLVDQRLDRTALALEKPQTIEIVTTSQRMLYELISQLKIVPTLEDTASVLEMSLEDKRSVEKTPSPYDLGGIHRASNKGKKR